MSTDKQIITSKDILEFRKYQGTISPIAVAKMLGQPLHPIQENIAKYFEKPLIDTWHEATWLMSRRLGKSYLGIKIATTLMLTPYSKIALIAHSTSLSDVWFKEILNDLMSIPEIKDKVTWEKKNGIIEIKELNTLFICCSYLNADTKLIGKSFGYIVKDEHFLVDKIYQEEIYNLVTPTTANFGSNEGIKYAKQIILSTPRGTITGSHAGRTYLKGLNGEKGFISFKHDIYESPFLTEDEIDLIRQTTPESVWLQEFCCSFTRQEASVAREFDKNKHVIPISDSMIRDMIHYCDIIVASDTGVRDGNAFSICLYNNKTDTYYAVGEHYKQGEIVYDFLKIMKDTMVDFCKKFEIPFNKVYFFADPSSAEMKLQANKLFDLTVHNAKNSRDAGIDYLNQILQGNGDTKIPKLYISDKCEVHISQLEYAEFKAVGGQMSNQFAKDPIRDSHYDVLQTLIYATFTHYKTSNSSFIIC
jgi:hypothetical protein